MADEHLVELSPYPASRVGASGFIGWSNSAGSGARGAGAWPALLTTLLNLTDDVGKVAILAERWLETTRGASARELGQARSYS